MALKSPKILSGKKFNKLTEGKIFWKLTYEHKSKLQYVDGLNIKTKDFEPYGEEYEPTGEDIGIYFIDEGDIEYWLKHEYTCIRKIVIPDDAVIGLLKKDIEQIKYLYMKE